MRLPESKIKQAILHPEEEIRLTALSYFSDSHTDDRSVMPLVIEAVEKYGREMAFRVLRDAENLPQTGPTVQWLITELRHEYDASDAEEDNYRFAIAIILHKADMELLSECRADFDGLPAFPQQLRGPLAERLEMAAWDWKRGWSALEGLGKDTMRRNEFTQNDVRYAHRVLESLARHGQEHTDFVLSIVERRYDGPKRSLMEWLEPFAIVLTGRMRLAAAIPTIVARLDDPDVDLTDSAINALGRIGTDIVVQAIDDHWWSGGEDCRGAMTNILEHIHTDLCVGKCLEYLEAEADPDVGVGLGHALLAHFAEDALEPVREMVLGDDEDIGPDERDLRHRLVAVATIMSVSFPEYDEWYQDAIETNWGWGEHEHARLVDAFRPDEIGPKSAGNGRNRR